MFEKWLVVGLGNPGQEYVDTRHNAGFILIDELRKEADINSTSTRFQGIVSEGRIYNKKCLFVKPQTFMNKSGDCVKNIANYYKIPLSNIIILHDDTNFRIGQLKIKEQGSAGGHKGVNSIIESFSTDKFIRIRIGVNDKPNKFIDLKDWVVSKFSKDELVDLKKVCSQVKDSIEIIVSGNIQKAMNKYNRK